MLILRNYLITFVCFMAVDLIWLGFVARTFYRNQIGFMLKSSPNWTAAIIFYLLYVLGILVFVLQPALSQQSWRYALFAGFFFGFITYMTYDLTNLATLKDWPVIVTVVDIVWGTVLGGATSILSYSLISFFQQRG